MQRRSSLLVDQASGCPFRIRHLDDVIENDKTDIQRQENEKPFRYEGLEAKQQDTVDKIVHGGIRLEDLPCQKPKVVRMFICSSGPDFDAERNYIFESVYPLVRQYCRNNHGIDFQLVDMYWGNPELPSNDPQKMAAVYEELSHCQDVSLGPNFVAFVGQKYSSVALPLSIPATDMEEIKSVIAEAGYDVALLNTWYQKDVNVTPNVYRLESIDCKGSDEWDDVYDQLVKLFQIASLKSSKLESSLCGTSDYENLLRRGLFDLERQQRDRNCLVYMRNIKNIDDRLSAKNAGNFVDLDPGTCTRNKEKQSKINVLREFVAKSVCEQNILQSDIQLNGCALHEEKSGQYITNIGRHFYSTVTRLVNERMAETDPLCSDPLIHELSQHWRFATQSPPPFVGREEILNAIKGYLLTESDQPLVIMGPFGSGKTTVISKAANDINEAVCNSNLSMPTSLVVRFIGETSQSEDVQPLLHFLCHQLAYVTGRYRQDVPSEYLALKNYLIDILQRGEYGGMLVILIDSLDKLSSTDNGRKLDWLPSRLASNVKVIVTVNSASEEIVQRLKSKVDQGIVHMPVFSPNECENTLKYLMKESNRTVTYSRWKQIQQAFNECFTPLYTKLVFNEVLKWHSYDDGKKNILIHSEDGLIHKFFDSLEKRYGKSLIRKVIGYLTVTKHGLSELELDDVLSLDDELLNDLYVKIGEYPNIRRIPHNFWSEVRQELAPFMYFRERDHLGTIVWRYSAFEQVARERYCAEEDEKTTELYSILADYYLGTWGGTHRKPFWHPTILMAKYRLVEMEDESCRYVPDQPLSFGENMQVNKRKMAQLPYLLLHSKRFDDLKSEVFCNYSWISGRLQTSSVQRVISDYQLQDDREIRLVGDALRMSKSALALNREALGMELTGRLLPNIHKYPHLKQLIRQCDLDAQHCCPLVANCQIYTAPGGPLQYECDLGGDANGPPNIDVFTSPDGILLIAKPNYSSRLRVWELTNGDERPDVMLPPGDVMPSKDGRFINIIVGGRSVKTYRSDSGVLHGEVHFGPGKIANCNVSRKYMSFVLQKGSGPYIIDLERSETLHKFKFHSHVVAISDDETYVAFNAERSILLYELPVMNRKCVATASDVANEIMFVDNTPKCYVMTKTKLIEAITFDVVNRKFTCKSVLTDLNAKKCVLSNTRELVIVLCDKTLHVVDTVKDKVRTQFQKLPPGVFVDASSTFSGAGFTPDDRMIVATRYTYLIVWDAQTCAPIRVLQSAVSPMAKVFTSDCVNKVVTLLKNNSFQVWDLDNLDRDTEHSIEIHQGAVQTLAVSSSTQCVLSHDNKTPDAKLTCLATGELIDTLQHSDNNGDRVTDVIISPDGQYAVTRAKLKQTDALSDMGFEQLTDDILSEVETATKVFHAISNRFIVFSPTAETAAFVTCAFYNSCDWSENIYHVFIVHPESSTNYAIPFPFHTEFVSKPRIVATEKSSFFVAVVQTCKKQVDGQTRKEVRRWSEIRLLVQKLGIGQEMPDQDLLRVHNLIEDADDTDEFLDIIPVNEGRIFAVYARNLTQYDFVPDKGIIPPRNVQKGAILVDLDTQTPLKYFPSFLDSNSSLDGIQISSQFTVLMDNDLRIFKFDDISFKRQIRSIQFAPSRCRLALNGRYLVGISENRRNIQVVRSADDKQIGSMFVHGRATYLEVAADDRTVVVGCEDGRIMILSLILDFADPLREYIEKMPSRSEKPVEEDLIINDVRRLSLSTPDQQRLSARLRKASIAQERRPPSYTTLQRAVTISRMSNRERCASSCAQQ